MHSRILFLFSFKNIILLPTYELYQITYFDFLMYMYFSPALPIYKKIKLDVPI